jgi:hypothetical protein
MGERGRPRRRVFIEDVRDNGTYLRTTWHPERRLFVVSTWAGEVCTGAVRLPAGEAAELATLLVDGLADASERPTPAAAPSSAPIVGPPLRAGGDPTVGPRDAHGRPQDAPTPPARPGRPVPRARPTPRPALPDWRTIARWLRDHRTDVAPVLPIGRTSVRPAGPTRGEREADTGS